MAIKNNAVRDMEHDKFVERPDGSLLPDVSVQQSNISASGSGRVIVLEINDTTWTEVPKLANRRAVSIQNNTNKDIKLNYSEPAAYEGMTIRASGGERAYDVGTNITMYLKSQNGTINIEIEEIS